MRERKQGKRCKLGKYAQSTFHLLCTIKCMNDGSATNQETIVILMIVSNDAHHVFAVMQLFSDSRDRQYITKYTLTRSNNFN